MCNFLTNKNLLENTLPIAIALLTVVCLSVIIVVVIKKYKWSLFKVDRMKGDEFEDFVKEIYELLHYKVTKTKKSGDQGIDLIVKKHFKKTGIQLKRYSKTVGNSAVQEAVAGKKYYKLDKVCVLTNRTFTKSAIALAKSNGVVLIDRNGLKELINKAKKRKKSL